MSTDPKEAIEIARAATQEALAQAAGAGTASTALVPAGADVALTVKARMAAEHAQVAKARSAALAKVNEAREAVKRQQAELEAAARALEAELAPLQEQVKRLNEGIWTMNLYLGRDEQIVQLREGAPAPAGTPVYVRQQVLAMDEESMIDAESGGMDVSNLEAFDAWVTASPEHLDQLLPEPRGVVAIMARRRDRDYGDPWVNERRNAENHATWWLIRNGEALYRMQTDFQVGARLVPRRDEFLGFFVDRWSKTPLEPGSQKWLDAEKAADARQRHYMRIALILQGLVDRTHVFAPLPKPGLSLLSQDDYDAGHVVMILDDEHTLTTGRIGFYEWIGKLNAQLRPGMRVMVATRHSDWPERSTRHYDYGHHERITPKGAESPGSGEVYTIQRRGDTAGSFVFTYERTTKDFYRDRWGHEELRAPKTRAACVIYASDRFVLPIDLVDVETMRTYMTARLERSAYVAMVPTLRAAIAFKEAEAAAEAPFRDLLAAQVAQAEDVNLETAHQLIDPVIATWKVGARWFRPLQGDPAAEVRAAREILAERARIARANAATDGSQDERFVAKALSEHRDALLVARKKDGTYVVLTPTPRRWARVDERWGDRAVPLNVFVTIRQYSKNGVPKGASPWQIVAPATVSKWIVLHEGSGWATWDKQARYADHLTDEEIEEALDQFRARQVEGLRLMVVAYEEDPRRSIYSNPKQFTLWYHPGPVTVPERLATGDLPYLAAHTQNVSAARGRDGTVDLTWKSEPCSDNTTIWHAPFNTGLDPLTTKQPERPWSDRRKNYLVWVDEQVLADAERDAAAWEAARLEGARLWAVVSELWSGVEAEWQQRAIAAAKARFMEDYADESLWQEHLADQKQKGAFAPPSDWNRNGSYARAARYAVARLVEDGNPPWGLTVGEAVDARLTAYVKRLVPEPRTARIAGNSVRLDLNFTDRFLPNLAAHLHYRMLDVTSWAGPAQWWVGLDVFPKQLAHTAMADIRESIAEMKHLREHLGLNRVRPSAGGQMVRHVRDGFLGITTGEVQRRSQSIDVQYVGGRYPVQTSLELLARVSEREVNE